MVVDTYVARVAGRLGFAASNDPLKVYRAIMASAPDACDSEDLYELHWLIKRLGQMWCTYDRAACHACVLSDICETAVIAQYNVLNRRVPGVALSAATSSGGYSRSMSVTT